MRSALSLLLFGICTGLCLAHMTRQFVHLPLAAAILVIGGLLVFWKER